MHAYIRDDSGGLNRVDMAIVDGEVFIGRSTTPTTLKHAGDTRLQGWGLDDGMTHVFRNPAGREVIVPRRFRTMTFLEAIGFYDDGSDDDGDTIELITTSELLRRLGIDTGMRAALTAAHGPIPDRLWSRDELAALTKGG